MVGYVLTKRIVTNFAAYMLMETRTCKTCGIVKNIRSFPERYAIKGGKKYRRHQCNSCRCRRYKPRYRKTFRDIAKRCRAKYNANKSEMKKKLMAAVWQEKCIICGEPDPVILCFHHRSKIDKKFCVSYGFTHSYGFDTLLDEAKKCDVICHNCHAKNHSNQLPSRHKDRIFEHIGDNKCKTCGESDARTLCFHHHDPSKKEFKLSCRFRRGRSWEQVLSEASKCILLCANCHIRLHATRAF
jgi:hypothetical protein